MEEKKISGKTLFIILSLVSIGILTAIGTYAYFGWSSDKEASISVSSVNGLGQCNKLSDNQKILWPVSNRNNGRIVNIDTKQTLSEYAYIVWTLTIDSINTQETETDGLRHQTFKYELVNTTTGISYGSGNFEGLDVGDTITFSNNTENLAYDTNYTFTLYLWIDGTIGTNPMDMTNQTYQFSLVCDITGEASNKTNERINTPILDRINPITDYEYEIGTGVTEGYVILKKYIGISPDVVIPDTYTINDTIYNTALFLHTEPMQEFHDTSTFESNTIVTNVIMPSNYKIYYYSQYDPGTGLINTVMDYLFDGCTSLEFVSEIPSSVTSMGRTFSGCTSLVNAPVIPSSVTYMGGTFSGCTSLVNAPVIPSSVTYMGGTFSGCTSLVNAPVIPSSVTYMRSIFLNCTSLSGTIRVNSSSVNNNFVSSYEWAGGYYGYHSFYGTVNSITVEVPEGSTTYTQMNISKPDNVTVTTFTPE